MGHFFKKMFQIGILRILKTVLTACGSSFRRFYRFLNIKFGIFKFGIFRNYNCMFAIYP